MSSVANKTMIVAVSSGTDTLTNFNQEQESYSTFKNTTISRAKLKNNTSKNIYEGTSNSFLFLSSDIFKQIDSFQNSYEIGELQDMRVLLIEDINFFTESANEKGIDNSQVMLARYILCTFSDEIICTTYWGKDNNWANSSLLGHFYNETYGGDKFFQILEQLLRAPAKYIDLLELMYICLSLGFEGKYRIQNKGKMELDSIRESLFRQMKMMEVRETKNFYASQKVSSKSNYLIYKTSYQILAISIALMLSLAYGILTFSLVNKENRVLEVLKTQYNKYTTEQISDNTSFIQVTEEILIPGMTEPTNEVPKTIIIKDLNE
ncbi:type IVB secretion system protein IcmH/DotU [Sulfurimonas sp.]|uniref:type IVB secretion system protein IcmH/DotU n=1 Tax=Sulfurimonas sp. TaxID=2022749 RepID=UPI002B4702F6|nr:type IVB secretion system protein IcmH/DotU [Sulfurimonas sp.]